jgi:ABC-type transport system substrate-binding protein
LTAQKSPMSLRLRSSQATVCALLDGLSQVYWHRLTAALANGASYNSQVGTGPFISGVQPKDHLTLVRNPDYKWGPSTGRIAGGVPQRNHVPLYEDPATRARH